MPSKVKVIAIALALLLGSAGFVVGRATMPVPPRQPSVSASSPSPTATPPVLVEAAGEDLPSLPRYPGSLRVEYGYVLDGTFVVTTLEYVVTSELDPVRNFYRKAFDTHGWTLAGIDVYRSDWTYFVFSGDREAVVEIDARGSVVEVEIELSEPLPGRPSHAKPTATPEPTHTPTPTSTPEPAATSIPKPTATAPPTPTPKPTATRAPRRAPEPAEAPEPTETREVEDDRDDNSGPGSADSPEQYGDQDDDAPVAGDDVGDDRDGERIDSDEDSGEDVDSSGPGSGDETDDSSGSGGGEDDGWQDPDSSGEGGSVDDDGDDSGDDDSGSDDD